MTMKITMIEVWMSMMYLSERYTHDEYLWGWRLGPEFPDLGGLRKELYVDFDEKVQIFNASRDISVPSEQIFLVDHQD
jgi:hypothetical protein